SARTKFWRNCGYAVLGVAIVSVFIQGRAWNNLDDAKLLTGPDAAAARARLIWSPSRAWPPPSFCPQGEIPTAIRYLNTCTAPNDRVLVTWWAPETFMFADRGFASGHA